MFYGTRVNYCLTFSARVLKGEREKKKKKKKKRSHDAARLVTPARVACTVQSDVLPTRFVTAARYVTSG